MHVIMVKVQIKPDCVEAFEKTMKDHVRATRKSEPGCVQFDIAKDKDNPRIYHLFEVYRDDQAIADHGKSPTLAAMREKLKDWVEDRGYNTGTLWTRLTD
jgi:(4S)-4-hydroxy-5-phosphonooxypentane-2,3-dione isomerase